MWHYVPSFKDTAVVNERGTGWRNRGRKEYANSRSLKKHLKAAHDQNDAVEKGRFLQGVWPEFLSRFQASLSLQQPTRRNKCASLTFKFVATIIITKLEIYNYINVDAQIKVFPSWIACALLLLYLERRGGAKHILFLCPANLKGAVESTITNDINKIIWMKVCNHTYLNVIKHARHGGTVTTNRTW